MRTAETDVLIIGAGPAGIAAAVQIKRSGWEPLLVEKDRLGGALLNAHRVENYPGAPYGISGEALAERFRNHLRKCGIAVHNLKVDRLSRAADHFIACYSDGEIRARAVIVATGCRPCRLGIPGEAELRGDAVFYERRDLPADFGGDVCIIGGGDAAFDYALALSERGKRITVCLRSPEPRSLHLLQKRARQNDKIHLLFSAEPISLSRSTGSASVFVHFRDDAIPALHCDVVLVSVGREPADDFIADSLRTVKKEEPLRFAGDVVNGSFRQVGIAVGDGLRCAMEITEILNGKPRL